MDNRCPQGGAHYFTIDGKNVGICGKCGETRRFPFDPPFDGYTLILAGTKREELTTVATEQAEKKGHFSGAQRRELARVGPAEFCKAHGFESNSMKGAVVRSYNLLMARKTKRSEEPNNSHSGTPAEEHPAVRALVAVLPMLNNGSISTERKDAIKKYFEATLEILYPSSN